MSATTHLSPDERHQRLSRQLVGEAVWLKLSKQYDLSDRELDVARCVLWDLSRDEIAQKLKKPDGSSLSGDTVRVYMDRLLKKMAVTSRVQLAVKVVAQSCLPEDQDKCHIFGD